MLYIFQFKTYRSGVMGLQTYTDVEIYREQADESKLIARGLTIKSVKDTHCRVLGQKYAIRNALRNRPDLPKTIRSAIWDAFFKRSKASTKLKGA